MDINKEKQLKKQRRKARIRAKVKGTASAPRLNVFKSNKGMYLQLIDDDKGITLLSVNAGEIKEKLKKTDLAFKMGEMIAKKALEKKIEKIVFDRGGNIYHGRVKAVAEGARKGGLKF